MGEEGFRNCWDHANLGRVFDTPSGLLYRQRMPHTSIASYTLHEVLHSGKAFTVYRAVHSVIEHQVVVAKVLHRVDADQTALRQALSQQAATLAQLTHPASVSFIDFIDEGPTCALVTALAPGRPLSDVLSFLLRRYP